MRKNLSKFQFLAVIVLTLVAPTIILGVVKDQNIFASPVTPPITPPGPTMTPRPTPVTPPVTPTARPTLSPKPMMTPRLNPNPTSTPIANLAPVISTTSLPIGYKGKLYNATITAYDLNARDSVTISASGFPGTITQKTCSVSMDWGTNRRIFSCAYSGTPKNTGTYTIKVTAKDNLGAKITKNFILQIKP